MAVWNTPPNRCETGYGAWQRKLWAIEAVSVCRESRVCGRRANYAGRPQTCRGIHGRAPLQVGRNCSPRESIGSDREISPRPEQRNGRGDDAISAQNTLSAETRRVTVFYPFHPLHGTSLQVVRRPKRGDGAVSVIDPVGKRLKIPVWMLLPECANTKVAQQGNLNKHALLSLTSLLATPPDSEQYGRDNLLQTDVDGCKGGQRGSTRASGPDDRKGIHRRVVRRNDQSRGDRSHGPHSGSDFKSGRRKR